MVDSSLIRKKRRISRNGHSLSLVAIRCHSLYHSLSLVVPLVVIRCHSLYHSLSLVVTRCTIRCHSLSLVVTQCTTRLSFYKRSLESVSCSEDRDLRKIVVFEHFPYSILSTLSKISFNTCMLTFLIQLIPFPF